MSIRLPGCEILSLKLCVESLGSPKQQKAALIFKVNLHFYGFVGYHLPIISEILTRKALVLLECMAYMHMVASYSKYACFFGSEQAD